jgi:Type II intron maturase/Reverse transcriptase (RNA-dependent DNA polymerase)
MVRILSEKIRDNRFLRLIRNMLQAGYLEDWKWNATLSGAPQGGVVSPILSNIYLHRLDNFAETALIPEYTRGGARKANPAYRKIVDAAGRARKRGGRAAVRELRKQQRSLPSRDTRDPGFRRLRYARYADDHLLGFAGPKAEAEQIKARLAAFLRDDLKLELSADKTLITHARTSAARFLGYEITVRHSDHKLTRGRREVNADIALRVPLAVIRAKTAPYMTRGKPAYRIRLMNEDDLAIISTYGAEYRGIVQYYLLAGDVWRLNRLRWAAETSLLKTLAAKHRSTVPKMAARYGAVIATPHGPRRCIQASIDRGEGRKPLVARFGGIPLKRQRKAVLTDRLPVPAYPRKELIGRLLADRCELCGHAGPTEVHQVRKLADLAKPGQPQPGWAELMAKRRRKTLMVCQTCHDTVHAGQPAATSTEKSLEPRALTGARDGSGGVRWKRTCPAGTSPASYLTSTPERRRCAARDVRNFFVRRGRPRWRPRWLRRGCRRAGATAGICGPPRL